MKHNVYFIFILLILLSHVFIYLNLIYLYLFCIYLSIYLNQSISDLSIYVQFISMYMYLSVYLSFF